MPMKFCYWSGNLPRWVAVGFVLLSILLTACEADTHNPVNGNTCAKTATDTAQATAAAIGSINASPHATYTMHFWRAGVIAVSLKLKSGSQGVDKTAIVNCLNAVLGKNAVRPLPEGTKIPNLITLNLSTKKIAVLFLSVNDAQMINIINTINRQIKAINAGLNVIVTGASPDWLSIGSPDDYIGGSPGGLPQEPGTQPQCSSSNSAGGNRDVYVLDTAPSSESIPVDCPAGRIVPTLYSFSADMINLGSNDNRLNQTFKEHGVFVSALIHHLAPDANIHLIQVLNDYGVGDVQSLLWGLSQVSVPGAIVNMSLTAVPPPACVDSIWQNLPAWQQPASGQTPTSQFASCADAGSQSTVYQRYVPLGDVISGLATDKMLHPILVAAAGNDSAGSSTPLPADAPAAYCGVISVAAAQTKVGGNWSYNNQTPLAPFSNSPSWYGNCLSSTEQTDQLHDMVAVGQSICSLFPQPPDEFALWSGTSFATAIVSGNLAAGNLAVNGGSITAVNGQSFSEDQPCG